MNRKIFQAIFGTSIAVLLASVAILLSVLPKYFSRLQLEQLRTETELAARGTELNGTEYLYGINPEVCRITLIAADGSIIYDNQAEAASMDNHLTREEVREAFDTGYGESSRFSSTLDKKCLYTAKLLSDGTVLRLSASQDSVWMLLLGTAQPLCVTVFAAIVLSLVSAYRISRKDTGENEHI